MELKTHDPVSSPGRMVRAAAEDGIPVLGPLLRALRLEAGLSQAELAGRAGLSARAIADLEQGRRRSPYPQTVRQLVHALGLGADEAGRLRRAAQQHPRRPAQQHPRRPAPSVPGGAAPWPPPALPAPTNLPAALTSFVGREHAVVEVRRRLDTARLLTLTGAGGVGKTRLALEVARAVQADYPDGVCLVELAALTDPTLVLEAVAAALGLPEAAQQHSLAMVITALMPRRRLLLLDNCEHLVEACAALAEALLRGCPDLTILATSREPLGIAGEAPWRVPSLSLPPAGRLTASQAATAAAVRLFAERAAVVQPHFAVTDDDAPVVAEVCRRLDGIPLALELAAARARMLPVEEIAQRLDDQFRLLTGGSRTALPRQQTLRATIDWSHDLLAPPERALWRRLAVFVGDWSLAAAEAVCADDDLAEATVLDLLTRLVDKSLVQADVQAPDGRPEGRYRLLETVRQYALARLAETADEAEAARDRHAAYYLALVERATAAGFAASVVWAERLRPEWGNVFAALRRAAGIGELERVLLACGALNELWNLARQYAASRALLAELLVLPAAGAATPGRASALMCAGDLAWAQHDTAVAAAYFDEAATLCRARSDGPGLGRALVRAGWVTALAGDAATGRARLEAALPLVRAGGDTRELAAALHFFGYIAYIQGEVARARGLQEESLALARQAGYVRTIRSSLFRLGQIAVAEGDDRLARARYAEGATIWPLGVGSLDGWAVLLRGLAALAAAEGRPVEALRLAGAAERLIEAAGAPAGRTDFGERDLATRLAACRAALGETAATAAWAAGRALTPEEAIAEAQAIASNEPVAAAELVTSPSVSVQRRSRAGLG